MVILASASPRRQELLKLIFDDFKIQPADIDETIYDENNIEKIPELLALKKAEHIFKNSNYDDIVIGSDTGVFIDGLMLGKPKDREDAFEMLKMLSGKKHKVITGCAVFHKNTKISFSQTTLVEFYNLSDSEILNYINTLEPMDKAGAYGIQGKGALIVKGIIGDYYNVMGLPVALLNQNLSELKLI